MGCEEVLKSNMRQAKTDNPLITVVTVVLNGELYIENTILSIINQTYDKIEYIIIDGKSTDRTLDIIGKYQKQIDQLVSEPDNGIYHAMNKAIDLATGQWIIFMNCGDSFYDKDVIRSIFLRNIIDHDVTYGDTQFVYDDGTKRIFTAKNLNDFWQGLRFYHQSVFVKTAIAKYQKFSMDYKISADFNFLFNLYQSHHSFFDTKTVIANMAAGGKSYNQRVLAFQECRKSARKHIKSSTQKLKLEWYYFVLILKVRINFLIRRVLPKKVFMWVLNVKDKIAFLAKLMRLGIWTKTSQLIVVLFNDLLRRLYSNGTFYGFHFDLTRTINVKKPDITVSLRKFQRNDISRFFNFRTQDYTNLKKLRKALEYLFFIKSGIPTCYVGMTEDEYPCVMCWLLEPDKNEDIQSFFQSGLPLLKTHEVFCEYVMTHPRFRGHQLMKWITEKLFEIAAEKGFHLAIAFVNKQNSLSLKASLKIGWQPFLVKKVRWRFFKRRITFEPFSGDKYF